MVAIILKLLFLPSDNEISKNTYLAPLVKRVICAIKLYGYGTRPSESRHFAVFYNSFVHVYP